MEHAFAVQGLVNKDSWEEYLNVFLLEVDEEDLVNRYDLIAYSRRLYMFINFWTTEIVS